MGASSKEDVSSLVRFVANSIAEGSTEGNIMDINGNTVGSFKWKKD